MEGTWRSEGCRVVYGNCGAAVYALGFGSWVTVITGAVFVVGVLAFRRGFVGEAIALLKKFPF